jgi:hypothetical protein
MKFLDLAATRIINEAKGVNRVVYDVASRQGRLRGVMCGCRPIYSPAELAGSPLYGVEVATDYE